MILLAGGVVLAGVGVVVLGGSSGPAAEISGAPLDPAGPAMPPAPPTPPPPPPPLDLGKLVLAGDHYEAPRGNDHVKLTLDPDLQATAEKLLAESKTPRAAIIAMTPDGRILAIAGRRTTDPTGKGDATLDPQLALDAWAPAASVFKLVTASALVAGGMDPDDKVTFHGGIRSVLDSNLRDDRRDNNTQSLLWGVAHSNNAILGKLAFLHLQPTALADQAHALGFDTGIATAPLGGVAATFGKLTMPSDHDLTFARTAAGFSSWATSTDAGKPAKADAAMPATVPADKPWGTQLSALGGAVLAATFADDGDQPTPYLVDGAAPTKPRHVLDREVARKVASMMAGACEFGSASRSFHHHKVAVAGKTGTLTQESPTYTQYSWFVGYTPTDKPTLIVAVVLGNPENWQMKGHEVARKLIDHTTHKPS
jgi:cell division protein FtsI/penicillin-binding protein 2